MKIKMILRSDAIFGNGKSIPGAEDISVLSDKYGFPYYKGGTFKGIFREELTNYLDIIDFADKEAKISSLLGKSGSDASGSLVFSDFTLSETVRAAVLKEIGNNNPGAVMDSVTNMRTFTAVDDGMVQNGSLRFARCVNQGLVFYSHIICDKEDEELICNVCGMIKHIGSMRNCGFGNVEIVGEGK